MTADREYFVALPDAGRGPGVVVLHEAWGLTPDIEWAAERLAGYGYVAFAPDLKPVMGGTLGALAQVVAGRGPLVDRVAAVLDLVGERPEVEAGDRLGVVGFSMGAALGLVVSDHPRVAVLGLNYGLVPPRARDLNTPLVASFGGHDRLLPRSGTALRGLAVVSSIEHDIEVYPGVGHSFMTPVDAHHPAAVRRVLSMGYAPQSADHAWARMRALLSQHMAVPSSR